MKSAKNLPASVRARLLNLARQQDRPFHEVLQYYVIERFLYRLSRSPHANGFVLKGALMLPLWGGSLARSTRDVDLLGSGDNSPENLMDIFRESFSINEPEDGVRFDRESLQGEQITVEARYQGARIKLTAQLDSAKINLQVDVGFGDVMVPGPQAIIYPTLLDFEAPRLRGYPPESMIAEKLEAMVVLDLANTRMKDFHDLWTLGLNCNFEGRILARAIKATFERRGTALSAQTPSSLTPRFYQDPGKQRQWKAFLRRIRSSDDDLTLAEVTGEIKKLVMPPLESIRRGEPFPMVWRAGGPWR